MKDNTVATFFECSGSIKYNCINVGNCVWKTGKFVLQKCSRHWEMYAVSHNCNPVCRKKVDGDRLISVVLKGNHLSVELRDGTRYNLTKPTSVPNQAALYKKLLQIKHSDIPENLGSSANSTPSHSQSAGGAASCHSSPPPDVDSPPPTNAVKVTPVKSRNFTNVKSVTAPSSKVIDRVWRNSRGTRSADGHKSGVSFYGAKHAVSRQCTFLSNSPKPSSKRKLGLLPTPSPKRLCLSDSTYSWHRNKAPISPGTHSHAQQGLSNLGNTCYMNAILQSLDGLDCLTADLLHSNKHHLKTLPHDTLFFNLSKLLICKRKKNVCESVKRELLQKVKSVISMSAWRFSGHQQHDAHEFLTQVLDQLKEEVVRLNKDTPVANRQQTPVCDEPRTGNPGLINPTVQTFQFDITHTIRCTECGELLTKSEQFNDLSIEIPRPPSGDHDITLQDALDTFFKDDIIEYSCGKCQCNSSRAVHTFARLPRVLILHIKRYRHSTLKISRRVLIPKYITLARHCDDDTVPAYPPPASPVDLTPPKVLECGDTPERARRRLDYSGRKHRFKPLPGSATPTSVTPLKGLENNQMRLDPAPEKSRFIETPSDMVLPDMSEDEMFQLAISRSLRDSPALKAHTSIKPSSLAETTPKQTGFTILQSRNSSDRDMGGFRRSDRSDRRRPKDVANNDLFDDDFDSFTLRSCEDDKDIEDNEALKDFGSLPLLGVTNSDGIDEHLSGVVNGCGMDQGNSNLENSVEIGGGKDGNVDEAHNLDKNVENGGRLDKLVEDGGRLDKLVEDGGRLDKLVEDGGRLDKLVEDGGRKDSNVEKDNMLDENVDKDDGIINNVESDGEMNNNVESSSTLDENVESNGRLKNVEHRGRMDRKCDAVTKDLVDMIDQDLGIIDQDIGIIDQDLGTGFGDGGGSGQRDVLTSDLGSDLEKVDLAADDTGSTFRVSRMAAAALCEVSELSQLGGDASGRAQNSGDLYTSRGLGRPTTESKITPNENRQRISDFVDLTGDDINNRKDMFVSRKFGDSRQSSHSFSAVVQENRAELRRTVDEEIVPEVGNSSLDFSRGCGSRNAEVDECRIPNVGGETMEDGSNGTDWVMGDENKENEPPDMDLPRQPSPLFSLGATPDDPIALDLSQEEEDIRRAKEISLQEFEEACLNEGDPHEVQCDVIERTPHETARLVSNYEAGILPHSYRLVGVVSHLGSSSTRGHYISDVYDARSQTWFSYDDTQVSKITERDVRTTRQRSGYIYFYVNRNVFDKINRPNTPL